MQVEIIYIINTSLMDRIQYLNGSLLVNHKFLIERSTTHARIF
jgi:hypothetical protein